jgi:hypothetical protein
MRHLVCVCLHEGRASRGASDATLMKCWKTTETLLERARNKLPVASEQEYVTLLVWYREFLEHNDLELALDALEEIGHLVIKFAVV